MLRVEEERPSGDGHEQPVDVGHLGPIVRVPRWVTVARVEQLVWAGPIVLVAVLGYTHRWTSDDGFAYFRVVDQIRAGNGPVFNAGQRVETFASPVWVALLTLGDLFTPFALPYVAAALSLTATVGGLLLATAGSARLLADGDRLRLPVGLTVIAVLWPTWTWSTGGEEIGVALAWIGACTWTLARWSGARSADDRIGPIGLVLLGIGPLVRPDLAIVSVVLVGSVVMGAPATTRRRAAMLLTACTAPVAYQLFRMGYYGLVTSSWSVAREDTATRPGFGWEYFSDTASAYLLVVPIVALGLAVYVPFVRDAAEVGSRRRVVAVAGLVGAGVANLVVVTVVAGGDSVHARSLLPGTMALLAPAFVVPVKRRYIEGIVVVALWSAACGVFMRPGNVTGLSLSAIGSPNGLSLDAGYRDAASWVTGPGLYVVDPFGPSASRTPIELADPDAVIVATRSIGAVAYALPTDVAVLDLGGIADPLTGHQALEFRYLPGQEKAAYAPWLVARLAADPTVVHPADLPDTRPFHDPVSPLHYLEQVAWAEAALECGPFERLADASDANLTVGTFFRNVWRAMSNTSRRYSADPRRAYFEEGCAGSSVAGRIAMRGPVPEAVQEFYERVETGPVLPADPALDAVAVAGRCDLTLLPADADSPQPWAAVDGSTFSVTVSFGNGVTPEPLTAVWVLGPFGADRGVVWLQTDGNGNFRVTQEINWFPQEASAWRAIEPNAPIRLELVPDLDTGRWRLSVDGITVAQSPMLSDSANGEVTVAVPQRAAPGHTSESPLVRHESRVPDRTCQAVLVANAEPGPVGAPRNGLPVASAT